MLERSVLLVTPTPQLSRALVPAIERAGYRVTVTRTFEAAKSSLAGAPDLLITELKLGQYNGLQLALRGRQAGIPTIVIAEPGFEQDVEQLGAVWLPGDRLAGEDVVSILPQLLEGVPVEATWPAVEPANDTALQPLSDFVTSPTLH